MGWKMRANEFIIEISDNLLQNYLSKADRHVSNRLSRMGKARERLNKNYEIYDVNNPTKIIDRFEANTPDLAREYYNKFIKEYDPGDQDFHFEVRRSTGLGEDISRRGFLGGLAGAAALGATGAQAKMHPSAPTVAQPVASNPSVDLLMKWAKQFIKDPAELAAFMAQCAHESDNFKTMNEYGTPERFAKKYDIRYNPKKAKELGNTQPGDGIKYRGRGYIQLTGKYNYQKAGEWISKFINHPVDFVKNPEMVATPTAAALSSIWYWINFVRPKTKSFTNTKQVTKHINTGLKGEKNREQKAKDWQAALNVKPIKPGAPVRVASR